MIKKSVVYKIIKKRDENLIKELENILDEILTLSVKKCIEKKLLTLNKEILEEVLKSSKLQNIQRNSS